MNGSTDSTAPRDFSSLNFVASIECLFNDTCCTCVLFLPGNETCYMYTQSTLAVINAQLRLTDSSTVDHHNHPGCRAM
jgi:hypothetical protein